MALINQTALNFIQTENGLFTQIHFDFDKHWKLNRKKTFRKPFDREIPQTSLSILKIHQLDEGSIRQVTILINEQRYRAVNAIRSYKRFLSFFKKRNPQTIGIFETRPLAYHEKMAIQRLQNYNASIELPALPIRVRERIDFVETQVSPIIIEVNYFPVKKELSIILFYTSAADDFVIQYGDNHEN